MPAGSDILARKFVVFEAAGLDAILTDTKTYNDLLTQTSERLNKVKQAISSGAYAKLAKDAVEVRKQNDALAKSARAIDLKANYGNFIGGAIQAQESMKGLTSAAKYGFAAVTGSTMAWVTAGLRGTVEADQLERGFTRISRSVAGTFKPTIDSAIGSIHGVADWFDHLSGAQQESIRKTVLWTAGTLGAVLAVNSLAKGVIFLGTALRGTAAANMLGSFQNGGLLGMLSANKGLLLRGGLAVAAGYALNEATKTQGGPGSNGEQYGAIEKIGGGLGYGASKIYRNLNPFMSKEEYDKSYNEGLRTKAKYNAPMTDSEKADFAKLSASDDAAEKKSVSLNQTGFGDIGSGWDRIAEEVLKSTALGDNADTKENTEAIKKLTEALDDQANQKSSEAYFKANPWAKFSPFGGMKNPNYKP
jgi:hypothetical protein